MTVWTVTPQPVKLAGVYSSSYLIRNAGETTVYLGTDSSLAVGNHSLSMTPGSTFNWAGKSELFAVVPFGTGTLEAMQDAGNAFTPGPTDVNATITDPISVGNQVDVKVSAPVDRLVSMYKAVIDPNVAYTVLNELDVSEYPSVGLATIGNFVLPNGNVQMSGGFEVELTWSIVTTEFNYVVTKEVFSSSEFGEISSVYTVKGNRLSVVIRPYALPGRAINNVFVSVLGYRSPMPESWRHKWRWTGGNRYVGVYSGNAPSPVGDAGFIILNGQLSIPASPASFMAAIDSVAGPAQLPQIRFTDRNTGTFSAIDWAIRTNVPWPLRSAGDALTTDLAAGFDISQRNQPASVPRIPLVFAIDSYGAVNASMTVNVSFNMNVK